MLIDGASNINSEQQTLMQQLQYKHPPYATFLNHISCGRPNQ